MRRPVATPPPPARRAAPRPARGAALLVVIVSTAILTAIAVDLAYSTRVSLLTAANSRDDLRAEYLARGGAQLARLVLKFQMDLDGNLQLAKAAVPGLPALPGAPAGAAGGLPRIQIWSLVPISGAFAEGLFGGAEEGRLPPGTFDVRIEDEQRKVNVQFDQPESALSGQALAAQVEAFLQLLKDPKWDPLFDREDANGQKVTRPDVAIHLRDWTDPGSVGSSLTGNPAKPFEDGFGDEDQAYSRHEPPYKTKNERFDSLDELYLVTGIDDAFMEAFGGQLTVFPDKNGLINVNTTDPDELLRNARLMAEPGQPLLENPAFKATLAKAVALQTMGGYFTIGEAQFAQILTELGVQARTGKGLFTDRSLVFRIHATGTAGAAERRVDAVVTFDTRQIKEPAPTGRLLHWREE